MLKVSHFMHELTTLINQHGLWYIGGSVLPLTRGLGFKLWYGENPVGSATPEWALPQI